MDSKERFYRQFQNSVANLQEQIGLLPSYAEVGGERQDAVEHVLSGISHLSNQVADAADFVPAYDQRTYSDTVKALRDQVNEETAKFTPARRFQFKQRAANSCSTTTKPDTRRLNPAANNNNDDNTNSKTTSSSKGVEEKDSLRSRPTLDNTTSSSTAPTSASAPAFASAAASKNYNDEIAHLAANSTGIRKPSFSAARDITLSNHRRVHITLPASASRATSAGTLTNLDRCVVDMSVPTKAGGGGGGAPFASLALKDIAGSVIVAGHVNGPVHVTNVRDSAVMVIARQVRIHECENVVFYLHCVSRPIIENCKGVRFAAVPESYLTDKERGETNLFDQVDDFKWLKATPSPNWSLLPESDAISDSTWRKALCGGPVFVVEDTLRSLRVGKGT